ncbi:unnamed protein product [Arabis nemorensis]|uniref:Uncharacterized protein n=1 Tax=Arabis nemorensis TaxID=586526 RepID=A0A565BM67_9BRAS|nr:unnamed protein product [Arabis nemorensis]
MSRSWPHPDAGSLVLTYVRHDFALHHKQLKIDNICESSVHGCKTAARYVIGRTGTLSVRKDHKKPLIDM